MSQAPMYRVRNISAALLVALAASTLTACQSRPQLRQVAEGSPEKPINTSVLAEQLKQRHVK